ncbi:thioredoxin domain-containing protein [Neolewinella aurantiaca]|uniref:Thioredoxin domain-containing protein n=1 Tax=Neolewinella aurantiaca TaxID=2602767 RepID=A0A5C7FU85_9BACT|nr:thioredoxin domain-containing protein [Neolewinella aurantiaca]TXF90112.1 thioredoxin domain-containing protein [Neolewinella aurantiaca]
MNSKLLTFISLALTTLFCTCGPAQNDGSDSATAPVMNHLAGQKSPYLLQHARNPVDWYPWGDEALAKAADENKLLIISVGYAACHWCHVMEHESFEDSTVAAVMNEHFVSIKVDREERPDVDDVYMTACQLSNQRGCGWPLNVVALPDGRPIWAGTYFPREQWLRLLGQFRDLQTDNPAKMEEYAASLTNELVKLNNFSPDDKQQLPLGRKELSALATQLIGTLDLQNGGAAGAPKFPMPVLYEFLLAQHFYSHDEATLAAVTLTLDKMADGGIYDHLAGGFARYSTDSLWKVPHFEKMLYDNGQLVSLYAHAYQATGNERYADVVRQTIRFVEDALSDPNGAFYASLDADTEGEEGLTYVWTRAEIDATLNDDKLADAFSEYYSVTQTGNWEGRNILHRSKGAASIAKKHGFADTDDLKEAMTKAASTLLAARKLRPQPGLDDKALTAWNSLMITGYTDAFRALGDEAYRDRAVKAGNFLRQQMMSSDGRLNRNFKDGNSAINAFLDDYALLAQACIDLYQITFDEAWLTTAEKLVEYAGAHFYDEKTGLYNYTSDLDPALISGNVPVDDQVIPSGNSIMARALHQLGILLAEDELQERARNMMALVYPALHNNGPRFYANWARLGTEITEPTFEVAILGADAGAMRRHMSKGYHPNALYLGGDSEGQLELLTNKLVPGETTIYVCLEKVCQLPVNDPELALGQLR